MPSDHDNYTSDHDLLTRIDERVLDIQKAMAAGAKIMDDHEKRLQAGERAMEILVPQDACTARHKVITGYHVAFLISLIGWAITVIGFLVRYH